MPTGQKSALQQNPPQPVIPDQLLRRATVEAIIGFGKAHIYDLMKSPDPQVRFPRPVRIGRAVRWSQIAVSEWIDRQKQAANTPN